MCVCANTFVCSCRLAIKTDRVLSRARARAHVSSSESVANAQQECAEQRKWMKKKRDGESRAMSTTSTGALHLFSPIRLHGRDDDN